MIPHLERPRITEIHVRIDCNGCVQKIKKALNGINGIYDLYIDLPQQKLTVIGWVDPERIIKAIKKVRKVATICSHTEAPDPSSQPTEPPPDGGAPPPDAGNPPPVETPNSEEPPPSGPPPQEPPNDHPPPQQPPENQPNDQPPPQQTPENPPLLTADNQPSQPENHFKPKDVEKAHVIYHHTPDYGYRYGYNNGYNGGHWSNHPGSSFRHEPPPQSVHHEPPYPVYYERPRPIYHEPSSRPSYNEPPRPHVYHEPPPPQPSCHEPSPHPVHVTHSYNTYRPSPYITEYEHIRSPPQSTTYSRMDYYDMDPYWNGGGASNRNVSSMFSDENPNACTIV